MDDTNAVDRRVGLRLRDRRNALGLTQESLSASVGVSIQQLHKYESGINRISASRLYALCHILDVPPGYFFDATTIEPNRLQTKDDLCTQLIDGDCRKMNEAFFRIEVSDVRRAIVSFIEALAAAEERPEPTTPRQASIASRGGAQQERADR